MVICFSSSLTTLIIERINIENKARIFFEVLDAVKEVIQKKKRARFNPSLHGPFGTTMDEKQSQRLNTSLKI
jgi:2,4-dienoyl-CoA reductase-like NADH-dependent reductase (Old Yellow Enzyme family)